VAVRKANDKDIGWLEKSSDNDKMECDSLIIDGCARKKIRGVLTGGLLEGRDDRGNKCRVDHLPEQLFEMGSRIRVSAKLRS
jgi:hypothetical protein